MTASVTGSLQECRLFAKGAGVEFPPAHNGTFLGDPLELVCLVLEWPSVPPHSCMIVPLQLRQGGFLAAVPPGFSEAGQTGSPDIVAGPSCAVLPCC